MNIKEDFYLGANTSDGFISLYNQLTEDEKQNKILVIKGGPGTGKSTIIRKVGTWFSERGSVEYGHCSSDPDSLDAVILKEIGVSVIDGTPPHALEPALPGAFESIIDLYPLWDEDGLEKVRKNIEEIAQKCTKCHKKAIKYMSIATILSQCNATLVESALDKEKIKMFCNKIIKNVVGKKNGGGKDEKIRFLSAITPKGVYTYKSTINSNYEEIYLIEDEFGVVSSIILEQIREKLINLNYSIITCYCVLSPNKKIEHILVPEIKVAFVTSNSFHEFQKSDKKHTIRARRFLYKNIILDNKQKLKFNNEVKKLVIEQSIKSMNEAKKYHDELEKLYTGNVDFKKMEDLTLNIIKKIGQRV